MTLIGLMLRRPRRSATIPTDRMPAMNAIATHRRWRATSSRASPITSRNHGPAQRVWIAICEPAVEASRGAMRQNIGVFRIFKSSSSCVARLVEEVEVGCSGTVRKMKALPARMAAAKIRNVARQPTRSTMNSVGAVAITIPNPPKDMIIVFASERRFSGTQTEEALKSAISPPAKPKPIVERAITSMPKPVATAKSAQPPAAIANITACTRRGP